MPEEHDRRDDDWDGRNRRRWHVKREIPLATIVALVVAFTPLGAAALSIYTRVSLLEQEVVQMQASGKQQDVDRQRIREDIKDELRDLNRKIDRLTQRLLDGNGRDFRGTEARVPGAFGGDGIGDLASHGAFH